MNDELPPLNEQPEPQLTERQADENLQKAIKDYLTAVRGESDFIVTGWILVHESTPVEMPGQIVGVTASDNLTDTHQLGLATYAQALLAKELSSPWGEEEN